MGLARNLELTGELVASPSLLGSTAESISYQYEHQAGQRVIQVLFCVCAAALKSCFTTAIKTPTTIYPVIPRQRRSPMEVVLSPTPLQRSYRKIIVKALLIAMETIYVNGNRRLVS